MIWKSSGTGDGTAATKREERVGQLALSHALLARAQQRASRGTHITPEQLVSEVMSYHEYLMWRDKQREEALRFLKEGPKK